MSHPLVDQFRFTRSEWLRGLQGVSEEDGACHFGPMNCISWTVGHLAWHEQRTWLTRPHNILLFPPLNELFAYGAPMCTPSFKEMLETWQSVTKAADPFLDTLTTETLQNDLLLNGELVGQTIGAAPTITGITSERSKRFARCLVTRICQTMLGISKSKHLIVRSEVSSRWK